MATLTNPLHSLTARGQLAKAIIYQTHKGKTHSKRYAVPGNTPGTNKMNQSPNQLAHQALFKGLANLWSTATDQDKASWLPIALAKNTTCYAAYTAENWRLIKEGKDPSTRWPIPAAPPIAAHVTNGTPPPVPDCTGEYIRGPDFNARPCYARITQPTFYIFFYSEIETNMIAPDPTMDTDNQSFWTQDNEEHTPSGTFTHHRDAAGKAIVTLV